MTIIVLIDEFIDNNGEIKAMVSFCFDSGEEIKIKGKSLSRVCNSVDEAKQLVKTPELEEIFERMAPGNFLDFQYRVSSLSDQEKARAESQGKRHFFISFVMSGPNRMPEFGSRVITTRDNQFFAQTSILGLLKDEIQPADGENITLLSFKEMDHSDYIVFKSKNNESKS